MLLIAAILFVFVAAAIGDEVRERKPSLAERRRHHGFPEIGEDERRENLADHLR